MSRKALANLIEEKKVWKKGFVVIGLDEVGRGSFAGPVVAAAVAFSPDDRELEVLGITDSKLLKPSLRRNLSREIKKRAIAYSISTVSVSTINRIGIGKATAMAMRKAISRFILCHPELVSGSNTSGRKMPKPFGLSSTSLTAGAQGGRVRHDNLFLLIDGFHILYLRGIGLKNQKAIIKGDQKSISIAAASILAKVYRDSLMKKLHRKHPSYRFFKNKGYGTLEHREAIGQYGLCSQHRTSFRLEKFL